MTKNLEIFEAAALLSHMNRRAGNDGPMTVELTFKSTDELFNFMRELKTSREWLEIEQNMVAGQVKATSAVGYGMTFKYHGITFFLVA